MNINKRVCRKYANPGLKFDRNSGLLRVEGIRYIVRTAIKNIAGQRMLLLYVYICEKIADGDFRPKWTMFQNRTDYATFAIRENGTTTWQTSTFKNLEREWGFERRCAFFSLLDEQRVTRFCRHNSLTGISALDNLQCTIQVKKELANRHVKQRKIVARMEGLPPLPRDLKGWIHREVLPQYLFYDYHKGKAPMKGYCTACRHEVEVITSKDNLNKAFKKVKANKGAGGVDGMKVEELDSYIRENKDIIIQSIRNRTYMPKPVRRVYISKDNGKQRPLGIPTVLDRVIQQAVAQPIIEIYEEIFSDFSYGFRPQRSSHDAIKQALEYLNEGYEWVIDIDIEQFFDKVNHDKLIQILREQVNDSTTLNLIRKYLKAGVMENGMEQATMTGVPQGGPLSVVLSNVYLDKLDKELEQRGLRFTRYADDTMVFTKSEMAANRVMKSITDWIERKLFLKVNATKTKVVRPTRSKYLGFTFLKNGGEWKVKPSTEKKKKLKQKLSEYLKRNKAIARPLAVTIKRVNEITRGWINYFRIGMMKQFMEEFGKWLRHKIRVIVMKQWKTPKTIYKNLSYMNRKYKCGFDHESIFKVANSRLGWYKSSGMNVVNFIISPMVLETKIKDGACLLNPLNYYLR